MALTSERIQYLELRATTDCLLAYQVGEAVEFYDKDALSVAEVCALPLTFQGQDSQGNPIPVCRISAPRRSRPEGDMLFYGLSFDVEWFSTLLEAGYPIALALEEEDEDGFTRREIKLDWRPKIERPTLRVVWGLTESTLSGKS